MGTWLKTVGRSDLSAVRGADPTSAIRSPAGVATLSVSNTHGGSWLVRVSSNNLDWPQGLRISVRRSSQNSSVLGGSTYLDVNQAPRAFIAGVGDQCCIELQLEVHGASVATHRGAYRMAITYSVEQNGHAFDLLEQGPAAVEPGP